MPTKTTKKTVAKKAPAKKPVKKTVAAAPVAKKPIPAVEIPLPDPYCHCTKRKRNMILTCVSTGCFLLGILVCHLAFCTCHKHNKPHMNFVDGCLDIASVKCPKMLQDLPKIDVNRDGCVTKAELRAAKKMMRHHRGPKPVAEEPAVVDAIAPVME